MQKIVKSSELQFSIKRQKPHFQPILAPLLSKNIKDFSKTMIEINFKS